MHDGCADTISYITEALVSCRLALFVAMSSVGASGGMKRVCEESNVVCRGDNGGMLFDCEWDGAGEATHDRGLCAGGEVYGVQREFAGVPRCGSAYVDVGWAVLVSRQWAGRCDVYGGRSGEGGEG